MRRPLILTTCLTLLGALLVVAAPAAGAAVCATPFAASYPAGSTQVDNTPQAWSQTDGNVIAVETMYVPGGPMVVIGGNFTKVTQPNGVQVPARNLAVLRLSDGAVMWGAGAMVGYPKTITARWGVIYVGGSFTSINGIARKAVAAFSAYTYAMLPWAPVVDGGTVRSLQVSDAGVAYAGGNGSVAAFRTDTAQRLWTAVASKGVVRSLLLSPDQQGLYVGGDFAALAGVPINNLAVIYPIAGGKVEPAFNPHLPAASIPGGSNGTLVLEQRWDLTSPQLRLVGGRGGSAFNGVMSIDPFLGGKYWDYNTEGDTQGLAMVGDTIASGYHRSHWNQLGCNYPFFGTQWAAGNGTVLPWDPGVNNGPQWKPTATSVQSEANGGVSDIIMEPQTHKVILVGDFSFYGGACDWYTLVCTGGSPRRGLAVYSYH